jgi:colanic acid biosynthesis glycosyl transferase WcaI
MVKGSKERLWLVCELYYPELTSTGHYVTQIGTGLAQDFDVKAICAQPNYSAKGVSVPKRDEHHGVDIYRVWSTTLDKNFLPFRLINMMTVGISMFLRSLFSFRRGDKVLVATAPWTLPYSTALAASIKGAEYTVLLHDIYPDTLTAIGKLRPSSSIFRSLEFLNRRLYRHAESLIVVGRDMQDKVREKLLGREVPVVVIPNWSDLEEVWPTPRSENPLLADLGIADKFVFMSAGNIGRPNDVETVVNAAEKLLGNTDIHFVFLGSGAKKAWIEKQVSELRLTNVSLLEPRPRQDQVLFLNAADVGLIPLVAGMYGLAMPSRTYNFLAAGKPLLALCDDGSELARVIDEENVGWHIVPGDPDRLAELIASIAADRAQLEEMGKRARAAAEFKYSPQGAIELYRRALTSNRD